MSYFKLATQLWLNRSNWTDSDSSEFFSILSGNYDYFRDCFSYDVNSPWFQAAIYGYTDTEDLSWLAE